jgi:hypothetical protein
LALAQLIAAPGQLKRYALLAFRPKTYHSMVSQLSIGSESMSDPRKALNTAILDVVNNQMRARTPPATKETFDRLVADGFAQDEARRVIGCVVASEIFDVLKHAQPYDEERYVKALGRLPELPE